MGKCSCCTCCTICVAGTILVIACVLLAITGFLGQISDGLVLLKARYETAEAGFCDVRADPASQTAFNSEWEEEPEKPDACLENGQCQHDSEADLVKDIEAGGLGTSCQFLPTGEPMGASSTIENLVWCPCWTGSRGLYVTSRNGIIFNMVGSWETQECVVTKWNNEAGEEGGGRERRLLPGGGSEQEENSEERFKNWVMGKAIKEFWEGGGHRGRLLQEAEGGEAEGGGGGHRGRLLQEAEGGEAEGGEAEGGEAEGGGPEFTNSEYEEWVTGVAKGHVEDGGYHCMAIKGDGSTIKDELLIGWEKAEAIKQVGEAVEFIDNFISVVIGIGITGLLLGLLGCGLGWRRYAKGSFCGNKAQDPYGGQGVPVVQQAPPPVMGTPVVQQAPPPVIIGQAVPVAVQAVPVAVQAVPVAVQAVPVAAQAVVVPAQAVAVPAQDEDNPNQSLA